VSAPAGLEVLVEAVTADAVEVEREDLGNHQRGTVD
jgi:hypothetical protein